MSIIPEERMNELRKSPSFQLGQMQVQTTVLVKAVREYLRHRSPDTLLALTSVTSRTELLLNSQNGDRFTFPPVS